MEIVCPFCPLRCQATPLELTGVGFRVAGEYCQLAAGRAQLVGRFAIDSTSKQTNWQELVLKANQRISPAGDTQIPLVVVEGTIIDIQTAREAVRLAARLRGHATAFTEPGEQFFQDVSEREGWIGATLGELSGRADSILLIGAVETRLPRVLAGIAPACRVRRIGIGIATVNGTRTTSAHEAQANGRKETLEEVADAEQLTGLLSNAAHAIDTGQAGISRLADWLSEAQYVGVLWTGELMDPLAAGALIRLVNLINQRSRGVLIPVSETATFRTVSSWLTGFSGPVDFQQDLPRLMERSETAKCETRIWLQPFPDAAQPPEDDAKLILVGTAEPELANRADVYIRTAMPGIETAGTTFRGDGTIALPLSKVTAEAAEASPPTACQILRELATAW